MIWGGHEAGDAALVQVAGALQRSVRKRDAVARLGGDEFAIVLHDCGVDRGLMIGRQIVSAVSAIRLEPLGDDTRLGVSIGAVPIAPPAPPPLDELVASADRACFAAKHEGRNQVVLVAQ